MSGTQVQSSSISLVKKESDDVVQKVLLSDTCDEKTTITTTTTTTTTQSRPGRITTFALVAGGLLILAWWISSLIVPRTRHRWLVQTLWAWFFVLIIIFRFIPASLVAAPVSALWSRTTSPLFALPFRARLVLAWLGALAITFGSAFGFARPEGTHIADRVVSLAGVYFVQLAIVLHSHDRSRVDWIRIPISITLQQALALFVLKSDAGFKLFAWFHTAVADFQTGAEEVTALIFDPETAQKGWFFVTGLAVILFFTAWVHMLYFFGWMQWLTKQFAWLGEHVLGASGAETFVALWTPMFGQVNSAVLVGPYIPTMTNSELFAIMATSMASISSLLIRTYTPLGATPRLLIAQSAILIPGAIVNAKLAFPEPDPEKVATRSRASTVTHNHTALARVPPRDILESLSDGAWLGLRVVGGVLSHLLTILALLVFINGISIWTFRAFNVAALDLHIVAAAPLAPLTFFLGVPTHEVWRLSYLLAIRILNNPDAAFAALGKAVAGGEFSARGVQVVQMAMAGEAGLPSLGIQLGVMTVFVRDRKTFVARAAIPALIIATFSCFQAAAIAGSVL